ncbi:receptor-activated Ca2+-permeable cation channel [Pholiota conissans]|uniref:Receptor-activated Ca2+-permeable cation channel n=1 Tax=Pholiota conissans TaxID=109636 RepID=A0A9P5ZG10_9AGAR|nr:receptor-activated Ca2+-permeable cation channel [Pholiota conissans]
MDPEQQASFLLAPTIATLASVKVFPLIPALKRDVTNTIDSALSWEQLTAADINFSIVRPIVTKYARLKNMSIVYVCLVVRSYFLGAAETELAFAGVMLARANLCEILAMKLLSRFATNYIQLVAVLTTTWSPLAGATNQVVDEVKLILNAEDDDIDGSAESAIEMAISTKAKSFLASPVTQEVVNDIYSGRVVFSVTAHRSILADNYKPRAIEIYNPLEKPFIDHYRLRVPKYGAYMEFMNFSLLLLVFILCLSDHDSTKITFWEMIFIILASAFTLGEYTAATEHGWIIYIANIWNSFDFGFILIFLAYLVLRLKGLSNDDTSVSDMAFDVLACGACILFPRLAFFAVSNNMVVLSLRAMISQFVFFIAIAAICFSGLLFTLWTLARDDPEGHQTWTFKSIAWLMVQIWFGNTYLSFAQAASFHPLFGPILMTIFAALSNTLLLTILISILSNTVARIDANATQEYLFQYTITTIEGVKSDALFSYQPPFNILAFVILKPASWFLTPRALHSVNVFLIKLTSLPQLVIIGLYERYWKTGQSLRESSKDAAHSLFNSLPRHIKNMPLMEALVGSASNDLYDAIFDVEIDDEDYHIFEDSDAGHEAPQLWSVHSQENLRGGARSVSNSSAPRLRPRRPPSLARLPGDGRRGRETQSAQNSPKQRVLSPASLTPVDVRIHPEVTPSASNNLSPLARLFSSRFPSFSGSPVAHETSNSALAAEAVVQAAANSETSLKHIESLLDAVSQLPVQKLKDEMKELQDRQARIENLLLMLTRGMRNETLPQPTHRNSTMT